jgi:glycosyltransferase involved in cell wall biosynthesis
MSVRIVMSCYNGEQFLLEQLVSIRDQLGPSVSLIARDDGSTDSTPQLLERFREENPDLKMEIVRGANLGAANSFMAGLELAGDFEHYAFADQDDLWRKDKLARAVDKLAVSDRSNRPALYYSNVCYTDADLQPLGRSDFCGPQTLERALFENRAVGCTIVLNHAARSLVLESWNADSQSFPGLMHDWWASLVVTALGTTVFDDDAPIRYRQHAKNEIGGTSGALRSAMGKARFFIRNGITGYQPSRQAQGLLDFYADRLTPQQSRLLTRFLEGKSSLGSRVRLALGPDIRRENWFDRSVVRALVLLNRY